MTDTREQLRGIARGGSLNLAGAVVSAAAAFLLVVIVTNTMNQSDAGQFFSGTSMFMIAFALSMLGTDAGLSRFTSLHLVNGQPEAVRACWSTAVRITLCLAIVVAVLAIIFRHQLADIMGMTSPDAPAMVAILALGLPPATLMGVSLSATRSLATMRPTVLIDKVLRTVGQTACALLALVVGGGLLSLGYAWSVPYIVGGGLALFMMRRFAARRLSPRNDAIAPTGVRREFWRFTWPRSVAQVSQMTIQRADIIIIGALISPAAAAIYTAATRFVAFGQFGTQAIQQTIQPRFANLLAAGKHTVLGEVYRTSTAWSILVSWPIYLAVGAAPMIYLRLFGDGYVEDGQLVVITMAIAMMIGVASGPVDTMLLMSGRSSLSLSNSLIALTTNLTLCFTLIPRIGILGAAIAWNAAVIVRNVLGYVQVRRATSLSPFSRSTLIASCSALICFGAPLAALSVSGKLTLPLYLGALGVLSLVYAIVLWFWRDTLELTALRALITRRGQKPL